MMKMLNSELTMKLTVCIHYPGFVLQGTDVLPTSPSGRLLLFTWWLFMMILTAMYTANLTTNLTIEAPGTTVDSLDKLLKQSYYKWVSPKDRYMVASMRDSDIKEHQEVYEGFDFVNTTEEAVEKVKGGQHVWIGSRGDMGYAFKDDCTKYIAITNNLQNIWALGMPSNAPYAEVINRQFITYREEGFFTMVFDKWNGEQLCPVASESIGSDTTFTPIMLVGLFIILMGGVLWAFVTSLFEFLTVAYFDSKENGQSLFQCLCSRISLKRYEITNEWFGESRKQTLSPGNNDKAVRFEANGKLSSHRTKKNTSGLGNYVLKERAANTTSMSRSMFQASKNTCTDRSSYVLQEKGDMRKNGGWK